MGMIFAPDPGAAAREMARACRPGGRIALTAWTRSGCTAAWRARAADLMAAPPPGPQPGDWGDPDETTRRMEAAGLDAAIERRDFVWHLASPEAAFQTFVTSAGPYVMFMETMREQGTLTGLDPPCSTQCRRRTWRATAPASSPPPTCW